METAALKRLFRLLSYHLHGDYEVVKLSIDPKFKFAKEFLGSFKDELCLNIIDTLGNKNGKKDLIKYYLFSLYPIQFLDEKIEHLSAEEYSKYHLYYTTHEELESFILRVGAKRDDVILNLYTINSIKKFKNVLVIINEVCSVFDIDLFSICQETGFPRDYFFNLSKPLWPYEDDDENEDENKDIKEVKREIEMNLKPIRNAFEDINHIDKIISGLISNDKIVPDRHTLLIALSVFIKPFGDLIIKKLVRRKRVGIVLSYMIKKNNEKFDDAFEEGYILRLLSEYTSKVNQISRK